MKKLFVLILIVVGILSNSNFTLANNVANEMDCTKKINFTPAQMKKLDQIYSRIYLDYVDLIETYAWAGALTQEQRKTRYKMLANYMKTFQARNYQWCSEHEEDEWEEEWYNIDNDEKDD